MYLRATVYIFRFRVGRTVYKAYDESGRLMKKGVINYP